MVSLKSGGALSLFLALSFCVPELPSSGLCFVGPFVTDKGARERFTRSEKKFTVLYNEAGTKICGWKK